MLSLREKPVIISLMLAKTLVLGDLKKDWPMQIKHLTRIARKAVATKQKDRDAKKNCCSFGHENISRFKLLQLTL